MLEEAQQVRCQADFAGRRSCSPLTKGGRGISSLNEPLVLTKSRPPSKGGAVPIYALLGVIIFGCGREKAAPPSPPPVSKQAAPRAIEVDLSDNWTPYLFTESDGSKKKVPNAFREAFIALANERPYPSPLQKRARAAFGRLPPKPRQRVFDALAAAAVHRHLEIYGIPPTLSVLRRRAVNEIGRACFEAVDYSAIQAFNGFTAYSNNHDARKQAEAGSAQLEALTKELSRRGYATLAEFRANTSDGEKQAALNVAIEYEALRETQEQLICEGLLDENAVIRGGLGYNTHLALLEFERKNRIFGWGYFGGDTLEALKRTPEARLYDALVRVVTERAVAAAGTIEDGSADAAGVPATYRDAAGVMRTVPNLVTQLREATLKRLGLQEPASGLAFLKHSVADRFQKEKVAVELPPLPPYYEPPMALSLEIDRGDVYYDYPYENGEKRFFKRERTPELVLYVTWQEQKIPLARMKTSIGGWQEEMALDGYVYLKFKNSEPGEGIIREIIAAPTWVPPESTPPEELVRTVTVEKRSVTVPDENAVGPWFESAYGLVAAVHLRRSGADGKGYEDVGIRSHGSDDYTSIERRFSHGCHRLYNHLAIRLYDFVLRHSLHRREGQRLADKVYRFEHDRQNHRIEVMTDGYVFELLNPLPVRVLEGNIRGARKTPVPHYMPKPGVRYGPDAAFLER